MGASRWDATIHQKDGSSATFDLRKLHQNKQLGPWYGAFMSSVRRMINGPATPPPRPQRRRKVRK
jgi:hypothetical protein